MKKTGIGSWWSGSLTLARQLAGFAVAMLGLPVLMWMFGSFHTPNAIAIEVLCLQLFVVIVALVGGLWPALLAAVCSGVLLDLFFIEPHFTVAIADPVHLAVLVLHIATALLVSYVVDRAARQTQVARRAAAESEFVTSVAGSVLLGQNATQAMLDRTREAFHLDEVRLAEHAGSTIVTSSVGDAAPVLAERLHIERTVDLGEGATLALLGAQTLELDDRMLNVIVTQLSALLERRRLEATALEIEPIAASDRVRGALLSALSHDLRRPLASATAAVGGLRAAGEALSQEDRNELLVTADESLASLTELVTDLLDVSRVQAGVLAISPIPLDPMDVIEPALEELGLVRPPVEVFRGHGDARILVDPVLLQRALVNLLTNALRFAPPHFPVRVTTGRLGDRVEIRVIDRGPGVPAARRNDVFVPFQRLGDTDNTTGLGLGLALARGFVEAMQGTLDPEDTPEGGLTMVVSLAVESGRA